MRPKSRVYAGYLSHSYNVALHLEFRLASEQKCLLYFVTTTMFQLPLYSIAKKKTGTVCAVWDGNVGYICIMSRAELESMQLCVVYV